MSASHHSEAMPVNTDAMIAVMSVEVRNIKEAVERMERHNEANVTRREWEQRNAVVDSRIVDVNAKVAAAEVKAESRRAPWWAVVGAGAGTIAIIAYLLDIVPRLLNPL